MVLASALMLVPVSANADDSGGTASSQEQRSLAQKHYQDGERLFREQKYDLARIEFEACFAITKDADLLHNLSLVAEKQGQIGDAFSYEETFLDQKRSELTQAEIDQAQGRMARLREQLNAPKPAPPKKLEAATINPPVAVEHHRPPAPAIGLMSGGAAALLIGIGCGAGSLTAQKTVSDGGQYFPNDYQALLNRGQALNSTAIAFDVIGGVALAAGATWAIVDRLRPRRSAAPRPLSAPSSR